MGSSAERDSAPVTCRRSHNRARLCAHGNKTPGSLREDDGLTRLAIDLHQRAEFGTEQLILWRDLYVQCEYPPRNLGALPGIEIDTQQTIAVDQELIPSFVIEHLNKCAERIRAVEH